MTLLMINCYTINWGIDQSDSSYECCMYFIEFDSTLLKFGVFVYYYFEKGLRLPTTSVYFGRLKWERRQFVEVVMLF